MHIELIRPFLCLKETSDFLDDGLLGARRQFGVDRYGEDVFARPLRLWKIATLVAECLKAPLKMKGSRVVDHRTNALIIQVGAQGISLGDSNDVLIVDMPTAVSDRWRVDKSSGYQPRLCEELVVALGILSTPFCPGIEER